jgi:hypothetical protein
MRTSAATIHLTGSVPRVKPPEMGPYRSGDLSISVVESKDPARIFLGFDGRSIERDPRSSLGVFLSEVLAAAKASSSVIELHCQRLTYINSATITCLVEHIRNCLVQDVRLTVRYNGGVAWQSSCFKALSVLAKDERVTITPL